MKDCFEHFLNTSTQYLISQDTLSSQSNSKVPIPRIRHPLTHNVIIHSQCNVYTYVCTYTITARVLTDNYYVPLIWYHSNTWIGLQEIWKMELRSSITRVVILCLHLQVRRSVFFSLIRFTTSSWVAQDSVRPFTRTISSPGWMSDIERM